MNHHLRVIAFIVSSVRATVAFCDTRGSTIETIAILCSTSGAYSVTLVATEEPLCSAVELPQVNVLSKVDLVESCGRLHFGLDFYTDVLDLSFLAGVLSVRDWPSRYA